MQDPLIVRRKLGQRIRLLRRKKGWSQERLAYESGLGRSFTGAIERGEKDIRLRTQCKLARVFNFTFAELMEGIDDLNRSRQAQGRPPSRPRKPSC